MFRYAFGRFYFALVGVLLLTLPLFALMRAATLHRTDCNPHVPYGCDDVAVVPLLHSHGPLYPLWQAGVPPYDYWPVALALLAAVAAFEAIAILRARRRLTAES